jgi:molybdopterin molybdotransferase
LLRVQEAIERILAQISPLGAETISTAETFQRVLAEDVIAPLDLPPFANSSMDGYAVRAEDIFQTPITLPVITDIPAGSAPTITIESGQAARIMTGAPLPAGADAVIPVEDTDSQWDLGAPPPPTVTFHKSTKPGANIRPIGENVHQGQVVLRAGTLLRPQDLGILASLGIAQGSVMRQPRVIILTTGDELLNPGQPIAAGKIYDANSPMLAALVRQYGGQPFVLPISPDDLGAVRKLFQDAIARQPDMIISSAGVSVGAADYVRTVLDELGQVDFWRINLRPGKPLAFGMLRDRARRIPFFGLPGNPVSAMVTFDVIVRPALLKLQSLHDQAQTETIEAVVGERIESDGRRSYLRVTLSRDGQRWIATLTGTQSSGALMSMVEADGLLIIPEDVRVVEAGEVLPVRLLRALPSHSA